MQVRYRVDSREIDVANLSCFGNIILQHNFLEDSNNSSNGASTLRSFEKRLFKRRLFANAV